MSTYISGGCKNGKSYYAQKVARAAGLPMYYVATMIPRDEEDLARIRRHRDERAGWGFETLERGRDILACLDGVDTCGSFLLDSVTALLSNEMFSPAPRTAPSACPRVSGASCSSPDSELRLRPQSSLRSDAQAGFYFDPDAPERIAEALTEFVRRAPNTVLVSDFIFSDAMLYDEWTETYRRGLATIDRRVAAACDNVIEVVAGQFIVHKGALPV